MKPVDLMKPVTIILPTYCPTGEIQGYMNACVADLANTPRDLYSLIVVEQGLRVYPHEVLRPDLYLYAYDPLGYARAVNLGVALADTEFICVLNNDLFVLSPTWLGDLISEFRSIESYGKVVGVLSPVESYSAGDHIVYDESWWSCVLLSRYRYLALGGLDDQLLNYRFHDQDFSIRAKKEGWEVCRTGRVVVRHVNSATYDAMGKPKETEESREMRRRHGVAHFYEWLAVQTKQGAVR